MNIDELAAGLAVELDHKNPGAYKSEEELKAFKMLTAMHVATLLKSMILGAAEIADRIAKQINIHPRDVFGNTIAIAYGLSHGDRKAFQAAREAAEIDLRRAKALAERKCRRDRGRPAQGQRR